MCVILHKLKENKPFTIEEVNDACEYNPDGFSLTILSNYGIERYKTINLKEFMATYKDAYDNKALDDVEYVIHCRIATNGKICEQNCHPFENDYFILWHNGIIGEFSSDKSKVDSKQFLDKYFSNPQMKSSTIQKRLDSEPSSRFVLYDKTNGIMYQSSNMIIDDETCNYRSNENHLWVSKYNYKYCTDYDKYYDSYDYDRYYNDYDEKIIEEMYHRKDFKDMTKEELAEYTTRLEDFIYNNYI